MEAGRLQGRIITALALAGIAGPVLFWVLLLVAQALYPGYDPVHASVSRLIFGPFGWLLTLNYWQLALSTAAFGIAVRLGLARTRKGQAASLFFMAMGLGFIVLAVTRVDIDPVAPDSLSYIIHKVAAALNGILLPVAAFLLAQDFRSDPLWRPLLPFTRAAATFVLLMQVAEATALFMSDPLAPIFGLYERILMSIGLAWMMVISARLLYIRRSVRRIREN